jgi:hypothetical protein
MLSNTPMKRIHTIIKIKTQTSIGRFSKKLLKQGLKLWRKERVVEAAIMFHPSSNSTTALTTVPVIT